MCACALHIDPVRAERQDGLKHFRCFIFLFASFFVFVVSFLLSFCRLSVILPVKHISQPSWSLCLLPTYMPVHPSNIGYVKYTAQQEHFQCSNIHSVWFGLIFHFFCFLYSINFSSACDPNSSIHCIDLNSLLASLHLIPSILFVCSRFSNCSSSIEFNSFECNASYHSSWMPVFSRPHAWNEMACKDM